MTGGSDAAAGPPPVGGADVAIVGDGPAGLALAAACGAVGLDVVVHGSGEPWTATYASWRDDVPMVPDEAFASITPLVDVIGARRHRIERPYGVFDNVALRDHLLAGLPSGTVRVGRVDPAALDAPTVVVATGAGLDAGRDVGSTPWQTAHGVVLADLPAALDVAPDVVTLMDWRPPDVADPAPREPPRVCPPSFCYVVPVHDGWLVEETVLAATPAVAPERLRARLERRLGADGPAIVAGAVRVEEVRIPMRVPVRHDPRPGALPRFGAAAGFVHPATGYSVAASLRAAPRVARAIAAGADVHAAVWPRPQRRARVLHDYGLAALLRLDAGETAAFFDAFFDACVELPVERWAAYLRVDATPGAVARVMARVFRRAPWSVRRRLMAGDPRVLRRLAAAS